MLSRFIASSESGGMPSGMRSAVYSSALSTDSAVSCFGLRAGGAWYRYAFTTSLTGTPFACGFCDETRFKIRRQFHNDSHRWLSALQSYQVDSTLEALPLRSH